MISNILKDINVSWKIVKDVLISFGFEEIKKEGRLLYLHFKKQEIFVQVPKENKIFYLTLKNIIDQSQIPEELFLAGITVRTIGKKWDV